ncbi:MAG: hypothetical protein ABJF50_06380 [Paracoccaceae bacterium]
MLDQGPRRWKTFDLTSQAFAIILTHWKPLLLVLAPIYLLQWGIMHFVEGLVGQSIGAITAQDMLGFLVFWAAALAILMVWSIGGTCLAVLWHRLVLRPSAVWPPFSALGWYLWEAFKLTVLLAVLSWIVLAGFGLAFSHWSSSFFGFLWAASLAFSAAFTWLWIRLGLVLPAAALGNKDMTLVTSWFETEGGEWSIFILALVQGAMWLAITEIGYWSNWGAAELFLTPLPVLLGLAALSVLYRDLETRTAGDE